MTAGDAGAGRSEELAELADRARAGLDQANRAREQALSVSRELVRTSANSIRATHRLDAPQAGSLLERGESLASQLLALRDEQGDIFYTGYVQDSLKEYAEARLVHALVNDLRLPDADDLDIPWPAYLNGLGEAASELRRQCLDLLRRRDTARVERLLDAMDGIYTLMATMDYPDAVTGGLRRTTDLVRSMLERTRADLTTAVMQQQLEARIRELHDRLGQA